MSGSTLTPSLKHVSISKFDGRQPIPTNSWNNSTEIARSAFLATEIKDGIDDSGISSSYTDEKARIANVLTQYWRGHGIKVGTAGSCFDSISRENHTGATLLSSDSEISRCRLYDNRDVNLHIKRDAGNCQSMQNHCYGSRLSMFIDGSQFFTSIQDIAADAMIGVYTWGWEQAFTNILCQHNLIRDMILAGHTHNIVNPKIHVARPVTEGTTLSVLLPSTGTTLTRTTQPYSSENRKVGVELGDWSSIIGGCVNLTDFYNPSHHVVLDPCDAIWVLGSNINITTKMHDFQNTDGANAIRVRGQRKHLEFNVQTLGYHQDNSRVLYFDDGANCDCLDIKLHIGNPLNVGEVLGDVDDYIHIDSGWSGSIKVYLDGNSPIELTEGAGTV